MTGFLTTHAFMRTFGEEVDRVARDAGLTLEPVFLPDDPDGRLPAESLAPVRIAYFSGDIFGAGQGRAFFAAVQGAPALEWMHCFNAGVDNPVFTRLIEQGVRLTTSSGTTAVPIAQSVVTGLLMLARGFVHFGAAQRRHAWERLPEAATPRDFSEQTLTVFGMGAIGTEIARLGRALGFHVIGVRRSPQREGDPVDALVTPAHLPEVLPRTDWLALACPLTDETRHVIDGPALSLLPRGARLLNIARGDVVDEAAVIEALRSGQLGGAYLDVFSTEPLPPESPLWEMPNVIISPHNSAVSTGNDRRAAGYFMRNLAAWAAGGTLVNEAH